MAFDPLLRLFVAWPDGDHLFPHPQNRASPEDPLEIRDIIEREIGGDSTFSMQFYDVGTINEVYSRPFEDREANRAGIEEIADDIAEFITSGDVDIAQRNQTIGVQRSDVVIRVVNSHENVPTRHWRTDRQVTYTFPVVAHGNVYALDDEIIAFAGDSGTEKWQYSSDDHILKVPTTTDDAVLVQDGTEAVALSPADGSEKWRLDCGVPLGIASRFEIVNDYIYFGTTDGDLYRIPFGGAELETVFTTEENDHLDRIVHFHGLFLVGETARSMEDGSEAWTFTSSAGSLTTFKGASETNVYFGSNETLYAVEPETGDIDWRRSFNASIVSTPITQEHGQTYISANNSVHAVEESTGANQWIFDLADLADISPANELPDGRERQTDLNIHSISVVDGQLVVISNEGMAAIDREGDLVWWHVFAHQSPDPNGLCHNDGTLWISTEFGDLYGVDIESGREIARYESASPISQPRLLDDDLVAMLKTYEHQHFDGHKQRVENSGELIRLDI